MAQVAAAIFATKKKIATLAVAADDMMTVEEKMVLFDLDYCEGKCLQVADISSPLLLVLVIAHSPAAYDQ